MLHVCNILKGLLLIGHNCPDLNFWRRSGTPCILNGCVPGCGWGLLPGLHSWLGTDLPDLRQRLASVSADREPVHNEQKKRASGANFRFGTPEDPLFFPMRSAIKQLNKNVTGPITIDTQALY